MKLSVNDEKRISKLTRYDNKEDALKEAVKITSKGDDICTVAKDPGNGKFVVCDIAHREVVYVRAEFKEVYDERYVLSITEHDEIEEV